MAMPADIGIVDAAGVDMLHLPGGERVIVYDEVDPIAGGTQLRLASTDATFAWDPFTLDADSCP